ncbi:Crp/Fnr family transcriptional regulator [Paenibacillus sp. MBLB4367]|uniref:Crp/Fnr family transcriptional regulator n=1 Tax=Paenibacillus sp. MBLB4367 TaxID=3384767 RepID=UPI0039082310
MAINCPAKNVNEPMKRKDHEFEGGISLFLSAEHRDLLSGIMLPKRVKAGSYLFWEGDDASRLYYIRSGRVKLRKTTEEGKDLILSLMQKGDLIGEMACGGMVAYGFSAEVIEDAEIGVLPWNELERLLAANGSLAFPFMNWLGHMNRVTQSKIRDLLLFGKQGALASTLIRLGNSFGVSTSEGIFIDIKLTNNELADMIGTARESVNRMLASLKDEGTIELRDGKIVIRRLENLRSICNCSACPLDICRM